MSFTPKTTYAPHPTPRRAHGFFMSAHNGTDRMVYCFDNLVYIRGLTNIFDVDVYDEHQAKTTIASYSPSGRWIASGDESGNVRVWTPQNADKTCQVQTRPMSGPIRDITWTGDNVRISVIGQGADNNYGTALNAETGSSMGDVMGHTKPVNTGCLRPTRPFRMVTAGDDCSHVFYKGPPFKFDHTAHDHERFVLCARFAPDGSVYATVGLDGKVCFYDGATGEKKAEHSYGAGITTIAFSPDSKQALISLMDGRALVIGVENGGEIAEEYTIGSEIYQQQAGALWTEKHKMTISLNGDFNFLEDGKVRIERQHAAAITAMALIEGGIATGDNRGMVLLRHFDEMPYAVWNPEGPEGTNPAVKAMATLGDKLYVGCSDKNIYVLNISDASPVQTFEIKKTIRTLFTLGDKILVHVEGGLVLINGGDISEIPVPAAPTAVALSPSGDEIAIGDNKGNLHFLGLDGSVLGTAKAHNGEVCAICYSPKGDKVASSGAKLKDITVFNRADLKEPIQDNWRFHSLPITRIAFAEDGVHLITASKDRSLRQWSLEKRRKSPEFPRAHNGQVVDFAFLGDNGLVTVGEDGAIKTWAVEYI